MTLPLSDHLTDVTVWPYRDGILSRCERCGEHFGFGAPFEDLIGLTDAARNHREQACTQPTSPASGYGGAPQPGSATDRLLDGLESLTAR